MPTYRHVKGADEVIAALQAYPAKVEARVVRNALAAGARVVRNAARAEVPVRTGRLAKSIRTTSRVRNGKAIAGVRVGDKDKGVFYTHFVLGGTKPHSLVAKKGKGLRIGNTVRKSVDHPGARANDFMGRAKASIPRAIDTIIERARVLTDKLNKEVANP